MIKEIQKLLDSDISAYAIYKATSVTHPVVTNLRNNNKKLDDIRLSTAVKLYNFFTNSEEGFKYKELIQKIFDDNTAYQISKKTDLDLTVLQKYANNTYKLENMTLKYAQKILDIFH